MKCSAENCKGYDEIWCKDLMADNKSCFEPVNPVQEAPQDAPDSPDSTKTPETYQGGELNPEGVKPTPDSEKHSLNHAIEEMVKLRKDIMNVIDRHLDECLKRAK